MKKLYPLTEAEQTFATEHFPLVGSFLRKKRLPEDEYYDVVVFGFLEAVQTQFRAPASPERQNFPALASICMKHAVSAERRYNNAEMRRGNPLSLDYMATAGTEDDDFSLYELLFDERQDVARRMEEQDLLALAHRRGTYRELEVMDLLAYGFSPPEAAQKLGISLKKCEALLHSIRRKTCAAKAVYRDGNDQRLHKNARRGRAGRRSTDEKRPDGAQQLFV